ncbi:organic hydroperoxide resistance protein [Streptomyces sp. NBC_01304]|uniref:organic hydroperoxide resistance protein n=1 Tax=Streptomyces sp. NBC_01304 TaxID=2903818 RepID=UPI002E16244F|nr:organic hydroperoxide resistance protein [Streptomyces sp. NBC_01304]
MSALYTAVATASGRDGRAVTSDVKLAQPTALGGDGAGTNPEQLFAAGYAACFASAMKLVAGKKKIDVTDVSVTAQVGLVANGAGGFGLEVTLGVEFPDEIPAETSRELLDATHQVCPYSNATRGNIPVNIVVE